MMASMQIPFAIMPALVYLFAGQAMARGGAVVSIGTLVAFTTLQTRLLFPVGCLLGVQADVQTSLALFDRVFEYLDLPVEIAERDDPVPLPRPSAARSRSTTSASATRRTAPDALRHRLRRAAPGTKVAVVGETGSGKTTLGYLAARLYDVQRGSVTIDGVDVRDLLLDTLRATVGVVSQETYLFHGTRAREPALRPPRRRPTRSSRTAARAARIYDMLAGLPEGLDTVVGERGYRFSGGEQQRLAIARDDPAQPAGAGAGRGNQRARRRDGARGAGGARAARRRAARRSRSPTGCRRSATPT